MSIATLLGFLACIAIIVIAILEVTSNFGAFFHLSGVLLVFGGTLASAFMGYEFRYVMQSLGAVGGLFVRGKANRQMLTVETGKIIRWGYLVKKSGLVALEKEIKGAKNQDHFMNYGIELVITGYSGDEVRQMLGAASNGAFSRNTIPVEILKSMAGNGPAFGMVGTLVGLVVMLQSLQSNPEGIGEGFAVAILATLYGVVSARMIFMPAASKLMQKESILRFRNFLVSEGFAMLADQKSPRYIQDKMNSYLDPAIHYHIDQKGGGGKGKKAAA